MRKRNSKTAAFLMLGLAAGIVCFGGPLGVEAGSHGRKVLKQNSLSVESSMDRLHKDEKSADNADNEKTLMEKIKASEKEQPKETTLKTEKEKTKGTVSKSKKEPADAPEKEITKSPEKEPDKAPVSPSAKEKDTDSKSGKEYPASWQIEEFPITLQNPELPTGCEITALAMVLDYYGVQVDKTVLAEKYLPKTEAELYQGEDGRLYGPDLNKYFVGDPFSHGLICGTEAIMTAADTYLEEIHSDLRSKDLTGSKPEELYRLIAENTPAVVWVTIYMEDRWAPEQGWYTEEGEYVDWSTNDHGAVLIGYTETTVSIADPISGLVEYPKEQFESVYASRGSKSVILQK